MTWSVRGPTQVREERIGSWLTQWSLNESGPWRALKWSASEETVSRAAAPVFIDITSQALGRTDSYKEQLLRGADYWRTVLGRRLSDWTSTETTAWQWATSTKMVSTISMFANPPDFPTGSIAIAEMEPLRM